MSSSASAPNVLVSQSGRGNTPQNVSTMTSASLGPKHSPSQARPLVSKRQQAVFNTFCKAIVGKSILILTDNADVRKSMTHVVCSHDAKLMFAKTSNDLWLKLRDPKECYDVFFLDLSKRELQVEQVLQIIRQDERYGLLPIVAVAAESELKEVVKLSCSYAVYMPLSTPVLREALLWCLDRR